ncbi:MAG: hypothetical protein FWC50_03015 [Planctomycetaceae bacterium]|nr:hypothetical protein [Planctomycetaceae bacterium]
MTTSKTLRRSIMQERRGVILLLVLAMMTLFAMLIATFMLVMSQQFREADSLWKRGGRDANGTDARTPQDDLQSVVRQLIRGSNLKSSVLRYQSLGATMYGDAAKPGLAGTATYLPPSTSPPYYPGASPQPPWDKNDPGNTDPTVMYPFQLAYSIGPANTLEWLINKGNVFTVYNPSDQTWKSTRILGYDDNMQNVIWVQAIPGISQNDLLQLSGVDFYINPPAFSGTGVGYVPPSPPLDAAGQPMNTPFWVNFITPRLTATDSDGLLMALQLNPNAPATTPPVNFDPANPGMIAALGFGLRNNVWTLNPDYTAPDNRSPFLAWLDVQFLANVDANGTAQGLLCNRDASAIIPSFHRPSLVQYFQGFSADMKTEDNLRKLVMRPMPFDHPQFSGSNSTLENLSFDDLVSRLADLHGNYLDVDSDGDGIKDSVWIDAGLPVRADSSGRLYKPMVAILCVDQDGKLNVNAQGNRTESYTPIDDLAWRGSGYGPAGIDLRKGLFAANTMKNASGGNAGMLYDGLLDRNLLSQRLIAERYFSRINDGETMPGDPTHNPVLTMGPVRAQFGVAIPQLTGYFGYYGALPDFWDRGTLLFDLTGNRFNTFSNTDSFASLGGGSVWPLPDAPANLEMNPYLFNPNAKTPWDTPFTLAELEAVLRQGDVDKDALPDRLKNILGLKTKVSYNPNDNTKYDEKFAAQESLRLARYNTTTMSNDVPVPTSALGDQNISSVYELIHKCVEKERVRYGCSNNAAVEPKNIPGYDDSVVDAITTNLVNMLPDEIRCGGKINLNKLTENPDMLLQNWVATNSDMLTTIDTNYYKALSERAKMARGMYILMMALSYDKLYGVCDWRQVPSQTTYEYKRTIEPYVEPSYRNDEEIANKFANQSTKEKAYDLCRELAATRIAQWAVNVVDFSDADAVMTPFIFDVNPFSKDYVAQWKSDSFDYANEADMKTRFDAVDNNAFMRLVWGLERSDLVMTETFATHDLRQGDTGQRENGKTYGQIYKTPMYLEDGKTPNPAYDATEAAKYDKYYDQVRIPQGNAFIELYCTTNPNQAKQPSELYFYDGAHWRLDLGRMTPQLYAAELDTTTVANTKVSLDQLPYPVWRVAVGKSTNPNNSTNQNNSNSGCNVVRRLIEAPDRFQPQPNQYETAPTSRTTDAWSQWGNVTSILGNGDTTTPKNIPIDRIVWFNQAYNLTFARAGSLTTLEHVTLNGPTIFHADFDRTFFNKFSALSQTPQSLTGTQGLLPNQYLVVGPRRQTVMGAQDRSQANGYYGTPSGQQFIMRDRNNVPAEADYVSLTSNGNAVTMVAAAFPPLQTTAFDPDQLPEEIPLGTFNAEDAYDWSTPATWFDQQANWQTGWTVGGTDINNLWLGLLDLPVGTSDTNSISGIGFSISEPLPQSGFYYKPPTHKNPGMPINGAYYLGDAYGDLTQPATSDQVTSKAKPFERADGYHQNVPLEADDIVFANDTVQLYKPAFLQRVADPNRPYNPVTNPYITVDWNMFDLNVFNSEGDSSEAVKDFKKFDQASKYGTGKSSKDFDTVFAARQWGNEELLPRPNSILANNTNYYSTQGSNLLTDRLPNAPVLPRLPNPWGRLLFAPDRDSAVFSLDPGDPNYNNAKTRLTNSIDEFGRLPVQAQTNPPIIADTAANIKTKFRGSLGVLNETSIIAANSNRSKITVQEWDSVTKQLVPVLKDVRVGPNMNQQLGIYYGTPVFLETTGANAGKPARTWLSDTDSKDVTCPFLNLPWNDAPFANSYQIMQVPASAPARFGVEFVDKTDSHSRRGQYLTAEALWQRDAAFVLQLPNPGNNNPGIPMPKAMRSGSLGSHARFGHLLNFQHAHNVGANLQFGSAANFADKTLFPDSTNASRNYVTNVLQYGYPHLTFDFNNPQDFNDPNPLRRTVGTITSAEFVSLDLGNLLNFVNVPSRFMGTRDWYYADFNGDSVIEPSEWYSYPRYREPGKLNINTLNAAGFAAMIENRPFAGSNLDMTDLAAYYNSLQNRTYPLGLYTNFEFNRGNTPAGFTNDNGTSAGNYPFVTPYRASDASWMLVSPADGGYATPADATLLRGNEMFARWLLTNRGLTMGEFGNLPDTEKSSLMADFQLKRYNLWLTQQKGYNVEAGEYAAVPDDVSDLPAAEQQNPNAVTKKRLENEFYGVESNGNVIAGNVNMPVFTPNPQVADNSVMALEGIQRLSDMTTTRSNVFAVWVTLGYFEVEKLKPNGAQVVTVGSHSYNLSDPVAKARFDAIYPDGYVLKKEAGADTGEIKRHRGFYMIDRSVPFGYRRGQDLNSEDAVLLKRFIE